ncbi:MAG: hypothetical protein H5T73_10145 [Actinobacteria bacterium]|nr:hypothetical protein [Actinomycetota bacterium]
MIVERGWFIPALQFGPSDVFLIEDWEETPVGPYRAVFHFTPEDFRTLYVDSEGGRDLVSSIHRFDRMQVVPVASRRTGGLWTVEVAAGDRDALRIEVEYAERGVLKAVNRVAPRIPEAVAGSALYCRFLPRLAAPLLGTDPGQRIAGVTELGRRCRFRLDAIYRVVDANCRWGGRDLGPLRECCFSHDMGDFRLTSKAMVSYLTLRVD